MVIYHRKQLPEQHSNPKPLCFHCCPRCPHDCIPIYWPSSPPQLPPSSTTNNDTATTYISPYLIVIVVLIATSILFITYYFIITRYCARFWQHSATQVNNNNNILDENYQPEIDHPIWYVTTVGLQPPVINSIRVGKFRKDDKLINYTSCSVCLNEFKDDESLRLLPKCNHAFHIPCIDTWLTSHTNCPLCRASVAYNNSNRISQSNDENGNHGFGLSQNSQMENGENDGELSSSDVQESESTREYTGEMGNVFEVQNEIKQGN